MKHLLVYSLLLLLTFSSCVDRQVPVAPDPVMISEVSATAQLAGGAVYPLRVSSNSRYLVDQNGTPVFISGDTPWSLISNVTTQDATTYLTNRKAYGFNAVIVNLIEHLFSTNASNGFANIYNVRPFTGATFATPNNAYFVTADAMINTAAQNGITVFLDPIYLGYNCGSEGFCAEVGAASTATMQSWGTYLGNRYRNFPNIVWLIGGDTNPGSSVKAKVNAFAAALAAADPNHIMTAHQAPESNANQTWGTSSWLAINNVYTYSTTLYTNSRSAYNSSPTRPFFMIESAYEGEHNSTAQQVRAEAYWAVLSGGCGEFFGNNPIWLMGGGWQSAITGTGSNSMKQLSALFNSRRWWLLAPDVNNTIITSGSGSGTSYATAEAATDGSSIIAYIPTNRAMTVSTTKLLDPTYNAYWFNPRDGSVTSLGNFARGSQSFTPPATGDWVFVADAPSFGFPLPGGSAPSNPAPTGTLTANPTMVPVGGGSSTLTWSSQGATSASLNQGIGTVSLNGSTSVNVTSATSYTLTLTGAGGTTTLAAGVTVATPPLPSGTFTATPSSITVPGPGKLKWTSQNALTASINQGIGTVGMNDSVTVNVSGTTVYTITLTNGVGTAAYNATVTLATTPVGEIIYNDAYQNSWNTIRSWSVTLTPANASPVQNGAASLKVVHGAWGSLQFSKGTWGAFQSQTPSPSGSLSFWVNGGPSGMTLNVSCIDASFASLKTPVTFSVPANTWQQKVIPMSSLATTAFIAIGFNAGGSAVTFYLDDIVVN